MPRTARPTRFLQDKWRIRWLDHEGRRRSAVFKSYKEADHQLRLLQGEAEQVKRGERDAPPPADKTVGDAIDYFEGNRSPRKRSCEHDKSIFRAHLRPAFPGVRLRDFGIAHVDRFVAERSHLHPKTVNNLLTSLITVLGVAHALVGQRRG